MTKASTAAILPSVLFLTCLLTAGCGSSSNAPIVGGPTPPPPATGPAVYVVQETFDPSDIPPFKSFPNPTATSILQFSASANGSATPIDSITPPPGVDFVTVATDSAGNIYVASLAGTDGSPCEILVYAAGASGAATPTRIIGGDKTDLNFAEALFVDASGQIYVEDVQAIEVFAAGASGNVAPVRYLTGVNTGLNGDVGLAVDSSGHILVTDYLNGFGSIDVFAPTADGQAAPTQIVVDGSVNSFSSLAFDNTGALYATFEANAGPGIAIFAPDAISKAGATGSITPTRIISGSATGLVAPAGIVVDASSNIYVVDITGKTGFASQNPALNIFSATASGNIAPVTRFTSPAWVHAGTATLGIH